MRPVIPAVFALLILSWPTSAQIPPYGGAQELRADLAARRAKAMEALGPESIAIFWSAPERVYSTDVSYEYRQDSNLLYLTSVDQEQTILLLIPGAKTTREVLFTQPPNPTSELWTGHILTPQELTDESGIARVYPLSAFQPFIDALMTGAGYEQSADAAAADFGTFFAAMKQGTAKIAVLGGAVPGAGRAGGPPGMTPQAAAPGSPRAYAESMAQKYPGLTMTNATPIVTTLRQVKMPYEQKLLRKSVEISAEAHIEGMKAAKPGRWEYEVEAAIEYWYLKNGAMSWGYPSIVGSGPNATTLHYEKSTRQMKDGDLLLVDAAANYQGLTGDITRTYPVNGKFTPAQREIYELVLAAQNAGIAAAQLGKPVADIPRAVRETFAAGLMKLGLITDPAQVSIWMPHGPTHGIGVDVHDPLGATLVAGSAFVIEPGLYFREGSLSNMGRAGGAARAGGANPLEAVRPVFERYKNIGVRIEDSFLMTDTGVVNLSAKAPRAVADIEKIVGTGK